jgi:hypothetical protein
MEADDDLVPPPDAKGVLDLTNRAWVNLDPVIWTMSISLVVLDLSYNHIHDIPPQVGELVLLKEFRASFNKIGSIPQEMGRLKRLRRLILNSNRLTQVPPELGRLEQMEELVLSENLIESVPSTLSLCAVLRTLKLQNNKLQNLPFELSDILTLEQLDVSNNPQLEMVPEKWRGDTLSILFICRIHRDYYTRMEELTQTNGDLIKHSQFLEQEQLAMKDSISMLKEQIGEIKKLLPKSTLARMERDAKIRAEEEIDLGDEKKKSSCAIL